MKVDLHVRAIFQQSMSDVHVGGRDTLSIMMLNCGLVIVSEGERSSEWPG